MRGRRGIHRLARNERGAAIVEFALASPVVAMLLLGLFDMSYNIYANTMLEGAIQKAARDSTIEDATPAELDLLVTRSVRAIVPGSDISFSRTAYTNFQDIARPEDFTDVNGDGICNDGEPYEDANGNGQWDVDRGKSGQGGARDAVMYEVSVSYARAFPLYALIGLDPTVTTQSRTVLRNQPYGAQTRPEVIIGHCN